LFPGRGALADFCNGNNNMRIYIVAAAIGVFVSQSASAADLPAQMPVRASPFSSAVYNWSGFYVGVNAGSTLSSVNTTDPTGVNFAPVGASIGADNTGFLGGLQLGFNFQIRNLVFGVQGDMSWTSIDAGLADPFFQTTTINYKTDWLATITGRIGYAWDNILVYGKGGAAWVHNNVSVSDPTVPLSAVGIETRNGWTAGGGFEYGFAPNWTGFIEYDYIGLGTASLTVTDPFAGPMPVNFDQHIQTVKGGINFKFGGF
jgi:outer membrane immunogenic protein